MTYSAAPFRSSTLAGWTAGQLPVGYSRSRPGAVHRHVSGHAVGSAPRSTVTSDSTTPAGTLSPADFEELVAKLRKLISAHLGLAGLSLTLALEKAQTIEEPALVARRMVEQIQGQQGQQVAAIAREALRRLIDD